MAAPDVEFTTKESREAMKFLFLKGKSAKGIYDDMSVTLDEKGPSSSTVKNWVARFKTGHFSTEDEDRPGRPLLFTVPENLHIVHNMILADLRIAAKKTAKKKDSGYISRTCRVHHSSCVGYEEAPCQMGAKMFECGSEA
jgi:hypothetical protein